MVVERDVEAYLAGQKTTPPATPVARRMAQEAGLDLSAVTPERAGGRVTRTDVATVLSQQAAVVPEARHWVDLSPTRQTIARRMVQSQQVAAHVTLTREVDATELVRVREQILQELLAEDPRPTYTDFLVSIVARQLRQHPYVNATVDGERFALSEAIHLGVAVDTDRGLMVPVVRHVDRKGLLELTQERLELSERVLDGTVTPAELSGGTFTITNLGLFGVDAFTPIINPPQVAILGVGRIRSGPAVHQGELCIRQLMYLSLTFDHRLIDGAPAARFLGDIARFIEKPFLRWL
jgi:pyruvate dehydrogenase E2 component (dihydrolipoamide acetyltransferase)